MARADPVLELLNVRSAEPVGRTVGALNLVLRPGDLALVDARDPMLASDFADLCCGLAATAHGEVRFLQRNWGQQPPELADALRGLIGRVLSKAGWLDFLDAETNILLQQLHHTRTGAQALRDHAARLARNFGLPGLPIGPIGGLSPGDLMRAGFVRAFLGDPRLVILESPVQGLHEDIVPALLNEISGVRYRGGSAIWLTRSRMIWDNPVFPATHRLRLDHQGLLVHNVAA